MVLAKFAETPLAAEAAIVDEFWTDKMQVWLQGIGGEGAEEGAAFDFASDAEAGGYGVQVAIVVAGMADELP